jgi:hypothetical protein
VDVRADSGNGDSHSRGSRAKPHGGDPASIGPLPFTGLALLTLVAVGAAFLLVGGPLRRLARPSHAKDTVPAVPSAIPAAPVQVGSAGGTRRSPAFALLALLGLLGIALLAGSRRHGSARAAA